MILNQIKAVRLYPDYTGKINTGANPLYSNKN